MKPIVFFLVESSVIGKRIIEELDAESGEMILRRFPDEEWYIKINSDVKNRELIMVASLNQPDKKLLPILFWARTARELGAVKIGLIAPYLAYLRQDTQFQSGEGITSKYFATLLSEHMDWLITVDPHLHRYKSLNEIYAMPTLVLHATSDIAKWIQMHVKKPILIGPDSESEQWVSEIAKQARAPYLIAEKRRRGDKDVHVSIPHIENFESFTPVLVDDIISTARTMAAAAAHLKKQKMELIYCIAVHAIFAEDAYPILLEAGASHVVTCNTIEHKTNAIDVSGIIINKLIKMIKK